MYIDPKIYNRENLKEEDRHELDFWFNVFKNVIANVDANDEPMGLPTLDKMINEVEENVLELVREELGYAMQDVMAGIIDDYQQVKKREEYTTYLHDPENEPNYPL